MEQGGPATVLLALGAVIRVRRAELDITQGMLALPANLPRSYISELEAGKRNVALGTVVRLADALGLDLAGLSARVGRELGRGLHPSPSPG